MDLYEIDTWVCRVLDKIGIRGKLRQTHKNSAMIREALSGLTFLHYGLQLRTFLFGSSIEGTTTPDMDPDMDALFIDEKDIVIEEINKSSSNTLEMLVVSDDDTYPGYVKLQIVIDGIAVTEDIVDMSKYESLKMFAKLDRFGKLVRLIPQETQHSQLSMAKHGPAVTRNSTSLQQTDLVCAFQCRSWDVIAQEWFTRKRNYHWPTKETIKYFQTLGFFLVPVSHPSAIIKGIDWRVSFSLQERELMFSLTDEQYKCYVLLKLIKCEFIKPIVKDAISSYHMKTCLFYVIERHSSDIWRREQFLSCVQLCLTYLLSCVREGNCPNYFIPAENMFHGRVTMDKRLPVEKILQEILSQWPLCLSRIKYDSFGEYLTGRNSETVLEELRLNSEFNLNTREYFVMRGGVVAGLEYKLEFLKTLLIATKNSDLDENFLLTVKKIRDQIELFSSLLLANTNKNSNREAILIVKPYFHTMLGSHLAVAAMQCQDKDALNVYKNAAFSALAQGEDSYLSSGILKSATVYYSLGLYKECSNKLDSIQNKLPKEVVTVCQCRDIVLLTSKNLMESLSENDRQNIQNFQKSISTCVMFLPTESLIVPDALKFEFYRCTGTDSNTRFSLTDMWYDWVVVDGIVYFYFLQYLIHRRMNKVSDDRTHIIKKLENCIKNPNIGHKETAYNLLSWMAISENLVLKALKYSMESWNYLTWFVSFYKHPKGNEQNNAAKWHMLVLLYKIWCQKLYSGGNESSLNFCFECLKEHVAIVCDKCKVARYCSGYCRNKNWETHKIICK